jgi:Ni/Fe-hydrogenase subunit HybB-like protein
MSTLDIVPGKSNPNEPKSLTVRQQQPDNTIGGVSDQITSVSLNKAPLWWWIGLIFSVALLGVFVFTLGAIATQGTGLWNLSIPTIWAIDIANLIFWIGIGHAGTFISAFLLLLRFKWRGTFSRFAEAMTIFALATAGLFPLFHLGRIEYFYYLAPYPNTMWMNPQWRSPLIWDFFAINTYLLISLLFWFIDLIPDIAALRDKAKAPVLKFLYNILSMGWRGDMYHWEGLRRAAFTLAVIATPLVISVHSIVGLDFAIAITPGWHHTIFPPFFVVGAIFSGMAMVILFGVILRSGFKLQNLIPLSHMDNAAKLLLLTGMLVVYGYIVEAFGAWYADDAFEFALVANRSTGPFAPAFWGMILLNAIPIQALWFKSVRRSPTALVVISLCVLLGMWLERFVIIPVSLSYPYLESMWNVYTIGVWDFLTIVSPFGLFLTLMFIFIRILPIISIAEAKQHLAEEAEHAHE